MTRSLKTTAAFLLAFVMLFSAAGLAGTCRAESVVRLVDPITEDAYGSSHEAITKDSLAVQDCVDFMENQLTYEKLSTSGNYSVRSFVGNAAQYDVYKKYVACLAAQPNLEQTEDYEQKYTDTFFSSGFDYIGSKAVPFKEQSAYTDVMSTIMIYGSIERNKLRFTVWIPSCMDITDLGYRLSGGDEIPQLAGPSALAGLDIIDQTSLRTTDGRLSVKVGEATVIHDGTQYVGKAVFERNTKLERDAVIVDDYYRNLGFIFGLVMKSEGTGDIYTEREMKLNVSYDTTMPTLRGILDYVHQRFFGAVRGDKTVFAVDKADTIYDKLTLRVMFYSEDQIAVYYVYAKFKTEPTELEALVAVDLSHANDPPSLTDETHTIPVGGSIRLSTGHEISYIPTYELFKWDILSGSDIIRLEGDNTEECNIIGVRDGEAVVRSTYSWGSREPDALGFLRYVQHERTRTYTIICGAGSSNPHPEDPPTPGTVIVGDVNQDGTVDATDRMILSRYLAKWDGYAAKIKSMDAADIDRNGLVEAKDRMILARYLAKWDGYSQYFK